MKYDRVLVTGGCGFIGSNFIRFMLEKYTGIKTTNLDNLSYAGRKENLRDIEKNRRYNFVKGDICSRRMLKKWVHKNDAVINFAAESHVDRSIQDSSPFIHSNVLGVQRLLDECLRSGTEFIQISTDEVYGSIKSGSFKEGAKFNPSSPYSASKAAAELLCNAYYVTHEMPISITRSSNNFGPCQFPEKFIPVVILRALKSEKIPVYGTGKNMRDWLYVKDNCAGIDTVLGKGSRRCGVYNIGMGTEKRNIDLAKAILRIMGKPLTLIEFVKDRKGHDFRYSIDSTKLIKLGWKPGHSFDAALRETVQWYLSNEWWWKDLV